MTKTSISILRKLAKERQKRPMRRIVQKSGTSCGVACVAMLSRMSYKDAFQLGIACYNKDHWSGYHGTVNSELRVMLAAVGYKLGREVACDDWSKVPAGSLAATQWNIKKDSWHWVVYDVDDEGGFVLDPNPAVKRNKRRDFPRMKVSCYHRVKANF
jgi:ABC-type bacteriocin/lantibiotic exporter with double-glycine peptidase domain